MDLTEIVTEDAVKIPLVSSTKAGVLRELVDFLDHNGKIADPDRVYRALLDREELGSTGLEQGIAVPHCKCDAVNDVTIAVGVSPSGVRFDSIDGELSRLFFLVIAAPNQSTAHLQVLSEIGELTRSESYLRSLMEAGSPEEFVRRFTE